MVIGNSWASCTGQDGRRRLDDPKDWVRLEVAAALRRNVLVVPVLVDGARLPDPTSLPEELRPLCRRNTCELSDLRWAFDVGELVKDLAGPRIEVVLTKDTRDKFPSLVVFPQYSEMMVDALKKAGADIRFTVYPNVRHDSWVPAFAEADLLPWLFSHSRKESIKDRGA